MTHPQNHENSQRDQSAACAKTQPPVRVVIAGGGTGGHLFPGIAIAETFEQYNPCSRVLFVGTDRPFEKAILTDHNFDHHAIPAQGIKGRSWWAKLAALLAIPRAMWQAFGILRRFRADLVVGVGGYSAGPVALAAWLMGTPIVIHEQNLLPGLTNRWLSRLASRIYLSFEGTRLAVDRKKICITGNPIRKEVLAAGAKRPAEGAQPPDTSRPLQILVLGGSQGAHSINQALVSALAHIRCGDRIHVVHQAGKADLQMARSAFESHGISCRVSEFIHDMGSCYRQADLIICRAGATTVAEVTVLGKACVFIPYPYAADNHQELNARELVNGGAAAMILERDLTGTALARLIEYYQANRNALHYMGQQIRAYGRDNAAVLIVEDCYSLLGDRLSGSTHGCCTETGKALSAKS